MGDHCLAFISHFFSLFFLVLSYYHHTHLEFFFNESKLEDLASRRVIYRLPLGAGLMHRQYFFSPNLWTTECLHLNLFNCKPVFQCTSLTSHLFICLPVDCFTCLLFYLFTCLHIYQFTCLFIYLCTCLPVSLFTCGLVYLIICITFFYLSPY